MRLRLSTFLVLSGVSSFGYSARLTPRTYRLLLVQNKIHFIASIIKASASLWRADTLIYPSFYAHSSLRYSRVPSESRAHYLLRIAPLQSSEGSTIKTRSGSIISHESQSAIMPTSGFGKGEDRYNRRDRFDLGCGEWVE